jgi:predicted CoA-binding protein
MPSQAVIDDFLAQKRLAFVGVSHDPKEFSAAVYRQLRDRGYELVPVNPGDGVIEGDPCLPDVASLPDGIDGAIVMVPPDASAPVVEACIARGIPRVWLHHGLGPSSATDEAVALCREHGIEVVDGACPMMFAEPVGWFHRVHRSGRRLTGHLTS